MEVIEYRKQCYKENKTIKEIFEINKPKCCYATFRNIIRGITYQDIPIPGE